MSDPIGQFLFRPRGEPSWSLSGSATAQVMSRPRPRSVLKPVRLSRGGPLRVEVRPLGETEPVADHWEALAERALERNVFAERVFVLAAARHIAEARSALAVLVWEDEEGGDGSARAPVLVGLFPVVWPRLPLIPGEVCGWCPSLAAMGVPLVDRARAEAVIEAYLLFLAERGSRCAGALFPLVPEDGPFAQALANVAHRSGRLLRRFDPHHRAVLRNAVQDDSISPKKVKELRRQLRRLGDLGPIKFERAREPRAVREAVETFFAIEASSWKGRHGTALIQDAGASAMVRTMTRDLARQGRCRVDVLRAGGQPVAAGITLDAGDRAFFWKIAYDERFARFSPGVQLTFELTRRQLERKNVVLTDSCAIADHPMIDHLWRDRMAIVDLFVSTRPGPSLAGRAVGAREATGRRIRGLAKAVYHHLTVSKTS